MKDSYKSFFVTRPITKEEAVKIFEEKGIKVNKVYIPYDNIEITEIKEFEIF